MRITNVDRRQTVSQVFAACTVGRLGQPAHKNDPAQASTVWSMRYMVTSLFVCMFVGPALAADRVIEVECFTEPYRQIKIAAPEMGVLTEILVAEGDQVSELQLLAQLDDRVLEKSLEVSRVAKNASGSLRAALSELKTTQDQLESYRNLLRSANATDREMQRATTAVAVADAKVQIVRDELLVRQSEYDRTLAQLENRKIKSPIRGTVVAINKEVGEYVSPSDPVIMSVVDLTQLKAIFSVPRHVATAVRVGQTASLDFASAITGIGVIEYIAPTTDPQSGTVRVKFRIENQTGAIPCGVLCRWNGVANDVDHQLSRTTTGPLR
ncbi:MAG: efflux RND transporter periplasmic adaptor subunit [Planctomycetales bacterium]|nr:efflux RND transporter periplasmic adaptor subunit [Planctomycetales bacterium]